MSIHVKKEIEFLENGTILSYFNGDTGVPWPTPYKIQNDSLIITVRRPISDGFVSEQKSWKITGTDNSLKLIGYTDTVVLSRDNH